MTNQQRVSKLATVSMAFVGVSLPALALGAFGAHFEILPTFAGFGIFFLGIFLGILAFITGGIGLIHTRKGKGMLGRHLAAGAFVIGGAILVSAVGLAVPSGEYAPPINDITTSPTDPPLFEFAGQAGSNRGQDMNYPAAFAALQQEAYPDIQPMEISSPAADTFALVLSAADKLQWVVTANNETTLTLEATDTTSFFHFVDDVIVRVRPSEMSPETTSTVDIRSRSRMGQGDMGANAARIRNFRDALENLRITETH